MMVTLLMSLEDALGKLSTESSEPSNVAGQTVGPPIAELRAHLGDVGSRVRTRVLYSNEKRATAASPLLRIVPWVRSRPDLRGRSLEQFGRALAAVGVVVSAFLVFEFVFTGLVHERSQADLLASFKQRIQTTTLDAPNAGLTEQSPVALLFIPKIGLSQIVVEGTTPNDLKLGPGHLRAAPLPGEFGNAVIAGRRTTYGAPFKSLGLLHPGDSITVTTGQGVFAYVVSSVRSVGAGQASPLTATLDTRLTLVTSDPAFMPSRRLIVTARLAPVIQAGDAKGSPVAVATRPPVAVAIDELGLTGESGGVALALVFGQLLILAIWLTRRFGRRWPLSLTVLFATPALLGLAVLFFSNIDRLLPGML